MDCRAERRSLSGYMMIVLTFFLRKLISKWGRWQRQLDVGLQHPENWHSCPLVASVALEEARGFVDRRAKSGNDGKPYGGGRVEEVILYFMPCSLFFFLVF